VALGGRSLNTIRRVIYPARDRIWMLVPTIALVAASTVPLGGCGGDTQTVSVGGSPTTSRAATAPAGPTATPTASTATTPTAPRTGGSASGGTPATTSTRTAAAPAFAEKDRGAAAEGLPAAVAVVHAHGYTAGTTSDYHPDQTLRVLLGTSSRSGDEHVEQAFFFVDGRYLGTDAARPSAQMSVVSQSDTEVTLAYGLYRPHNSPCCPGGGEARVRFQLNNGRLVALDPIPPARSTTGTSRQ
jgi:hypothetical protein